MKTQKSAAQRLIEFDDYKKLSVHGQLRYKKKNGFITSCQEVLLEILDIYASVPQEKFVTIKQLYDAHSRAEQNNKNGKVALTRFGRKIKRNRDRNKALEIRKYYKRMADARIQKNANKAAKEIAKEVLADIGNEDKE